MNKKQDVVTTLYFDECQFNGCCGILELHDLYARVKSVDEEDIDMWTDERGREFNTDKHYVSRKEIKELKADFNRRLGRKAMLVASTIPSQKGEIEILKATGWKPLCKSVNKSTGRMITLWSYGAK